MCSQEHILKFGGPSFWIIWMRLLSLGGAGRCNKCTLEKLGCEYESVYVQFWKIAQIISNQHIYIHIIYIYLLYESTFSSKSVRITDAQILCCVLSFSLFLFEFHWISVLGCIRYTIVFLSTYIPMSHVISHVRSCFEPKIIPMPCFATWGYHRKLCLVVSNLVVFNPLNNGMMIPSDEI